MRVWRKHGKIFYRDGSGAVFGYSHEGSLYLSLSLSLSLSPSVSRPGQRTQPSGAWPGAGSAQGGTGSRLPLETTKRSKKYKQDTGDGADRKRPAALGVAARHDHAWCRPAASCGRRWSGRCNVATPAVEADMEQQGRCGGQGVWDVEMLCLTPDQQVPALGVPSVPGVLDAVAGCSELRGETTPSVPRQSEPTRQPTSDATRRPWPTTRSRLAWGKRHRHTAVDDARREQVAAWLCVLRARAGCETPQAGFRVAESATVPCSPAGRKRRRGAPPPKSGSELKRLERRLRPKPQQK